MPTQPNAIAVDAPGISRSRRNDHSRSGEIAGPVQQAERIVAIDVLRGVALCGILVINIRVFAQHWAIGENPHALGEVSGLDWWTWVAGYLFSDLKMMAIFSMLFGAGLVLMASRLHESGRRPARIHYSRMLWLLVFGLAHAYLIWSGDVLVWYAVCGAIIYIAWRWPPLVEIGAGVIVLSIGVALILVPGHLMPAEDLESMSGMYQPTTEQVQEYIAAHSGSWLEQMPHRAAHAFEAQLPGGLFFGYWRSGGLMLLGMGLFKLGVFSAERTVRFYARLLIACLAIGMPLVVYGLIRDIEADFAADAVVFGNGAFNYIGSVFVALAWVALVMLLVKLRVLPLLARGFAAVGQMALTNYLMQSVLCTLVFFGHGFGLFGRLGIFQQMGVVLGIWAAELLWSPLWLRHFRFGPFEWLWRSLTYWRLQPVRRVIATNPAPRAGAV